LKIEKQLIELLITSAAEDHWHWKLKIQLGCHLPSSWVFLKAPESVTEHMTYVTLLPEKHQINK
jgi:hypothetical protein